MMEMCRRGVIYPTMKCQLGCEFCYYRDMRNKTQMPFEKVEKELEQFKFYYDLKYIDITGGEPTIYPHIKEMVKYCDSIGLKPTVITNAQIPKLFPQLIDLGLEDLLISIHGIEEDHDRAVCRQGAFRKILETIEILQKKDFTFRTNTVITSYDYKNLAQFAQFLKEIKPRIVNLIIFNPHQGTLWSRQREIKFQTKHSEIAPYIKEAIDILMEAEIWVNVRYFPLCLLQGYEKHICNFHQWQYDPYEWEYISAAHLNWKEVDKLIKKAEKANIYGEGIEKFYILWTKRGTKNNIKPSSCSNCINYDICDGIYKQYARRFGVEEFKPVEGEVRIRNPLHYRSQDMRWSVTKLPT